MFLPERLRYSRDEVLGLNPFQGLVGFSTRESFREGILRGAGLNLFQGLVGFSTLR